MNSNLSRRKFLSTSSAAGALAVTAATVGCGGDDEADPTSVPATAASGATTAATAAATKANLPTELIVANEREADDLFPYFGSYPQALVMRQVYETMAEPRMTLAANGVVEVKLVGRLAESWQQVEPTRWRFKLRQGVTFHNGEKWDAEAAKVSFLAMADAAAATALKKSSILARGVKSIEVIDAMTVDIITPAPDNELLAVTMRIGFSALPPKLFAEKGMEYFRENPVGTGPFKFKSWTRGQEIKLEQYEGYWNKSVSNIKSIKYITRSDVSVRTQTVKTGEAHFAYNIGPEQAASLKKSVTGGGFQSTSIRLNNGIAPTSDIRVRRAVNYAIDRNAIVKSIFRGAADPIGFFAFQPVKIEPFAYKPDEAKRLIDEAGIKGQTLEFVYGEGRIPEEDQLAEIYKASLEAVGIKVKLTKLEPNQYNELGGKPAAQQPPLYMETTSSGNFGDAVSGLKDKYGCAGTGTFCSADFDKEFAALQTLDGSARNTNLQSIADRLQKDFAPRAWIAGVRQVHGMAESLTANLPLNAYILMEDLKFA